MKYIFPLFFILLSYPAFSQSYSEQGYTKIAASRYNLPTNNSSGLTNPGFVIWGKFTITAIGDKHYLYLRVRYEHSTTNNPNPSFWYSYKHNNGKIYTDNEIGKAPFQTIKFSGATFSLKVYYADKSVHLNMGNDDYKQIGEVPKDFDLKRATVFVEDLVWYNFEAADIRNAISNYENGIKKKKEEEEKKQRQEAEELKKKKEEQARKEEEARKKKEETEQRNRQEIEREKLTGRQEGSQSRTHSSPNSTSEMIPASKVPDFQKLPDFFVDEHGNSYKKERDHIRRISNEEYQTLKNEKKNNYQLQAAADQEKIDRENQRKYELQKQQQERAEAQRKQREEELVQSTADLTVATMQLLEESGATEVLDNTFEAFGTAVGFLFTAGNWEFIIAPTFNVPKDEYPIHVPEEHYSFTDYRWRITYGWNSFRFNFSPLALTSIHMPSYKKSYPNLYFGDKVPDSLYESLGTIHFYSPSIGISYVYLPGRKKDNRFHKFEFPLSVNVAGLFFGSNGNFKEKYREFSSLSEGNYAKLRNTLKGKVMLQASAGFHIFASQNFGIGLSAGLTKIYLSMSDRYFSDTNKDLQGYSHSPDKVEFELDKLNQTVGYAEMKVIFRFN